MRKLFTSAVLLLFLSACTQTKMAYLDIQEIMKEYKGTKEAEAEMKISSDKLKAQFDTLVNSWQTKGMNYEKNRDKMSAKVRAENEQALAQEQQMLTQRQQEIQQQVQMEGQESLKILSDEINEFVKNYAKSKGLSLVLGTSGVNGTVVYGDSALDITDDVLVQLNKEFKSKKSE